MAQELDKLGGYLRMRSQVQALVGPQEEP
jgi:hypothetical protein